VKPGAGPPTAARQDRGPGSLSSAPLLRAQKPADIAASLAKPEGVSGSPVDLEKLALSRVLQLLSGKRLYMTTITYRNNHRFERQLYTLTGCFSYISSSP